jgi:hypothetical protein
MFQTTRFSRPMLKSGRLLTIALLALASFGAPALSAQTVCCPLLNYRPRTLPNYQQPAPARGVAAYYFNINGTTYGVDDNLNVWLPGLPLPVGHIVAAGNGRYLAYMNSGARYWAYPVQ